MMKRIVCDRCCGLIVDVQQFFLSKLQKRVRSEILLNVRNLVRLLDYLGIPILLTLERPVRKKGGVPREIKAFLSDSAEVFEKSFFDLSKEKEIEDRLRRLQKRQLIVGGCETDVCVLQSCLGLLSLGYEVYLVEELLFSASRNVESAMARMRAEGAIFISYKTLYFELLESVEDCGRGLETSALPPEPL